MKILRKTTFGVGAKVEKMLFKHIRTYTYKCNKISVFSSDEASFNVYLNLE
jgi:hypothetical protein